MLCPGRPSSRRATTSSRPCIRPSPMLGPTSSGGCSAPGWAASTRPCERSSVPHAGRELPGDVRPPATLGPGDVCVCVSRSFGAGCVVGPVVAVSLVCSLWPRVRPLGPLAGCWFVCGSPGVVGGVSSPPLVPPLLVFSPWPARSRVVPVCRRRRPGSGVLPWVLSWFSAGSGAPSLRGYSSEEGQVSETLAICQTYSVYLHNGLLDKVL